MELRLHLNHPFEELLDNIGTVRFEGGLDLLERSLCCLVDFYLRRRRVSRVLHAPARMGQRHRAHMIAQGMNIKRFFRVGKRRDPPSRKKKGSRWTRTCSSNSRKRASFLARNCSISLLASPRASFNR